MRPVTYLIPICICVGLGSLTGCPSHQGPTQPEKISLYVALFPYLPDAANDKFKELARRIEEEFELENPSIDLVLRPLNPIDDDFYDFDTLSGWLTTPIPSGGYHIVEVDAVLLGDLASKGVIAPWTMVPQEEDWHPASSAAVRINDKVYGVPHWLCSYFIFSRDASVAEAKTIKDLLAAYKSMDSGKPLLAGNLLGSWDLPAEYLDAWADTYGRQKLDQAISPVLDQAVVDGLKHFAQACMTGEKNPCLDGTYKDAPESAAKQFAATGAHSLFGYSERLHFVMKGGARPEDMKIASAPLGQGSHPLVFVDALVLRRDCDAICQKGARAFAMYMNSPKTHEWIGMSRDAGAGAVPRYLLPATRSAFRTDGLRSDPHYQQFEAEIRHAAAYPNTGLLQQRKVMRDRILADLKS